MKITKQQLMDIVSEELETLREASGNINVSALSSTEISLAIGVINFFGTESHPMATKKSLAYFKVDYLADLIKKNKNRLEATAKKHLDKMVKKLSEGTNEDIGEATDKASIQKQIDQAEKYLSRIHGNSSSVKMKKFAIQKKIDKLKKQLEETISEKESKFDHDIFFGLQKLISTRSKNNKLKGYSSEVAHAVTDILTSVEEDRLSVGEVFRALHKLGGSADKR